jgi:uncharacterized protein (TIGR04255 family)
MGDTMTWSLTKKPRKEYPKNPLDSVVVQLRFAPILKISELIPQFQEGIRERLPEFERSKENSLSVNSADQSVTVEEETKFQFRDESGQFSLTLKENAIALSHSPYSSRENLLDLFYRATNLLEQLVERVRPKRLGVRYINTLNRERMASELGKQAVEWGELVNSDYLPEKPGVLSLKQTSFLNQINSVVASNEGDSSEPDSGEMTLRYGLVHTDSERRIDYRLDIDRFVEGGFDVGSIPALSQSFIEDIYSMFHEVIGETTLEWMSTESQHGEYRGQ